MGVTKTLSHPAVLYANHRCRGDAAYLEEPRDV